MTPARPGSLDEFGTGDRFEVVASAEVFRRNAVDLSEPPLGKGPERREQIEDARFGKPVENSQPLPSRQNQPGVTQNLQMARGIGDRERRTVGKNIRPNARPARGHREVRVAPGWKANRRPAQTVRTIGFSDLCVSSPVSIIQFS